MAGRLDGKDLIDAPHLSLDDETWLIEEAKMTLPATVMLIGIDAYGVDYLKDQSRHRAALKAGPVVADAVAAAVTRALKAI